MPILTVRWLWLLCTCVDFQVEQTNVQVKIKNVKQAKPKSDLAKVSLSMILLPVPDDPDH